MGLLAGRLPGKGAESFVAPDGVDSNPGTIERPFATLVRARGDWAIHPGGFTAYKLGFRSSDVIDVYDGHKTGDVKTLLAHQAKAGAGEVVVEVLRDYQGIKLRVPATADSSIRTQGTDR